jgi:hypothetical protein
MLSKPQALVRPEGLGKLKNLIHVIGSRTRDILACNIVLMQHFIRYGFWRDAVNVRTSFHQY